MPYYLFEIYSTQAKNDSHVLHNDPARDESSKRVSHLKTLFFPYTLAIREKHKTKIATMSQSEVEFKQMKLVTCESARRT
jgi:hypothetical protein